MRRTDAVRPFEGTFAPAERRPVGDLLDAAAAAGVTIGGHRSGS